MRVGGVFVLPGADRRDSGGREVRECVEQRVRAIVERVIVREGDRINAELSQSFRGYGRSTEEERLRRVGEARAAIGDAALEIEQEGVGGGDVPGDFRCD